MRLDAKCKEWKRILTGHVISNTGIYDPILWIITSIIMIGINIGVANEGDRILITQMS